MKQIITITKAQSEKRIDQISIEGVSRSQLVKQATFFLNNQEKPGKTKVKEGEIWTIEKTEDEIDLSHITPWNTPLNIVAESKSWAALNKPYGVSVHPSSSEKSNQTIVNALVHHFGKTLSQTEDIIDGITVSKPGLVHRLDKTTSGLLLIAKNNQAHQYLQEHWSQSTKIYTALVDGIPPKKGRVEAGIIRDPKSRIKMSVSDGKNSKKALTTFETLETKDNKSLLNVQIHTGRTHQIRVHLSSIGFPIVGDELYGGSEADRIYLHSTQLIFPDPDKNGEMKTIECPAKFDM